MSIAAGEYISVSAHADTKKADITLEEQEIVADPLYEHAELCVTYVSRGLDEDLADKVASQYTQKNSFSSHIRDEPGILDML